jgi:hypothetical protein
MAGGVASAEAGCGDDDDGGDAGFLDAKAKNLLRFLVLSFLESAVSAVSAFATAASATVLESGDSRAAALGVSLLAAIVSLGFNLCARAPGRAGYWVGKNGRIAFEGGDSPKRSYS